MKPLVIYHKGCTDGMVAAWCFWSEWGDSMEYYAASYGNQPPDVFGRDVYLVDFCYPFATMQALCEVAKSVILLDHHASALEDVAFLKAENFDMSHCSLKKSGARIAWDYVGWELMRPNLEPPQLLLHVQDRDLWKFELEFTKEITLALHSYEMTFETYNNLMHMPIELLRDEGRILERKNKIDIQRLLKSSKRNLNIAGWDVPVVNAPPMYASELGNLLSEDAPFAATYYDTKDLRIFSLRSNGEFDVTTIAKQFGGGGHLGAAGFSVKRNHTLAKV